MSRYKQRALQFHLYSFVKLLKHLLPSTGFNVACAFTSPRFNTEYHLRNLDNIQGNLQTT